MKFYKYRQNNSGGEFTGSYMNIFIEANTQEEAEEIAIYSNSPIYFDGCKNGSDCKCCGDRWSRWADDYEVESKSALIYQVLGSEFCFEMAFESAKHRTVEQIKNSMFWGMKNLIILKNGEKIEFDSHYGEYK